ncbi:HNH endonuclease [Mycobacterium phage MalagasyRose]|uniref:HNH endonuclease n=1 Tax=Mycobacterium phage MalagasyRose TaxID=2599870 RepID=A0A5J6TDK8_9CAUD|nr:HNH endonuclease [Mycobacterium phage MalagasyRose]QFG08916.1 HNH endonuclease [Mycobacterium phage MalagasyRose]
MSRPRNRWDHPAELLALHDAIRFQRADGRCECEGQCGRSHKFGLHTRCGNIHGRPAVHGTDKTVSLAVRYLDGDDRNHAHTNLIALCQTCGKRHHERLQKAAERAASDAADDGGSLFDLESAPPPPVGAHL